MTVTAQVQALTKTQGLEALTGLLDQTDQYRVDVMEFGRTVSSNKQNLTLRQALARDGANVAVPGRSFVTRVTLLTNK